ncbi:MAG: hypothetical protein AB1411_05700 [Nitrospirota bacterium]
MVEWNWDKFWRWNMGLVLPVTIGSACLDRQVIETLAGLWEDPTPWRVLFFVSSAFLLIGFARNTARLRKLTEAQADAAHRRQDAEVSILEPCND